MLYHIPQVLTPAQLHQCRQLMNESQWVNGKVTAGTLSAAVKHNQQLPQDHPFTRQMGEWILTSLSEHPLFLSAALPLEIIPPLFNRYAQSDAFGLHVDNAIRPIPHTGQRLRTDLSCTLFLSEPDDYEGGELVIEDSYGVHEVKLPAGDLILYPSTSLHEVTPVTQGTRLASFFWVQSMVRDDATRHILFELDQSIQQLRIELGDQHAQITKLTQLYHNLMRKWAEL